MIASPVSRFGIFGTPHPDLASRPADAIQTSPHIPGAYKLEDIARGSFVGMVIAAPPGTQERRYTLALSLRALAPGAPLTVMAPKEKGGSRIAKELETFGCTVAATSKRHQRICQTTRPISFTVETDARIDAAIADGAPCFVESIGLWSQPGIFSWNRIDSGTALLLAMLPEFAGRGADLGCGLGVIGRAVLAGPRVTHLALADLDHRAIAAACRNISDTRATFHWVDLRVDLQIGSVNTDGTTDALQDLDFVVMNPPFHDGGLEDRALGETFIRKAHRMLRNGGKVWLVANRHLPYEAAIFTTFPEAALRAEQDGFKVYEATK